MEITQTALFLGSIINLYCLVLILRVWLQLCRVDFYSPLSQFVAKATQTVVILLRKVFPTVKNIETASLVLIFLLCALKSVLLVGFNFSLFLLIGLLGFVKNIGVAIFYVLVASAILSWFNQGGSAIYYALYQLTEPLLKPIRRILPTIGMIDFSPMVIAFILLFLNNLFYDFFQDLWMMAG